MKLEKEEDFLLHIGNEIQNNRLILPTLPDIALQVREMLARDDITARELAELIGTDAALSARLIQVVNSPLYRGKQNVTSLQAAVSRLGQKALKLLVTSLVIQQIFSPPEKHLELFFRRVWEQSTAVSSASRALAKNYTRLDPDQAMLAGLIHSIGKLPILVLIEKNPGLLKDRNALETLIDKIHPAIGRMIMEAWDFPEEIRQTAWLYLDFLREGHTQPDYVDVVQVAYIESLAMNPEDTGGYDALRQTATAYGRLGISVEENHLLLTPPLADEIRDARALFADEKD